MALREWCARGLAQPPRPHTHRTHTPPPPRNSKHTSRQHARMRAPPLAEREASVFFCKHNTTCAVIGRNLSRSFFKLTPCAPPRKKQPRSAPPTTTPHHHMAALSPPAGIRPRPPVARRLWRPATADAMRRAAAAAIPGAWAGDCPFMLVPARTSPARAGTTIQSPHNGNRGFGWEEAGARDSARSSGPTNCENELARLSDALPSPSSPQTPPEQPPAAASAVAMLPGAGTPAWPAWWRCACLCW